MSVEFLMNFGKFLKNVRFWPVFHVEHHLAQVMRLTDDFPMSGRHLCLEWPLSYIGQKRTQRPRSVNELRLYIGHTPGAMR